MLVKTLFGQLKVYHEIADQFDCRKGYYHQLEHVRRKEIARFIALATNSNAHHLS